MDWGYRPDPLETLVHVRDDGVGNLMVGNPEEARQRPSTTSLDEIKEGILNRAPATKELAPSIWLSILEEAREAVLTFPRTNRYWHFTYFGLAAPSLLPAKSHRNGT